MALSIKSDEADRLARDIASETGENLTDAVVISLRERKERLERSRRPGIAARLDRLTTETARLRVDDARGPDEIVGYDENGLFA
jgi:antitoxin VapB